MLENGAGIRFTQAMFGHKNLSTTGRYTQVSIETLREIHAATHPDSANKESVRVANPATGILTIR
jgi:site-specific recombinase XerD